MKNTLKATDKPVIESTATKTPVKEIKFNNESPMIKAITSQDDEVLAKAIRDLLKRDER